jgi:hypothetical protein
VTGVNPFGFSRMRRREKEEEQERESEDFRRRLHPWLTGQEIQDLERVIRKLARETAVRLLKDLAEKKKKKS